MVASKLMRALESMLSVAVMLVSLTACAPAQPPLAQPAPQATVGVAPTSSARRQNPAPPVQVAPAAGESPLFDYQQDGNAVGFVSPDIILFRRASHGPPPCRTQLRWGENTSPGPGVESAFRNSEVSFALQSTNRYRVDGTDARLAAPGYPGSITWTSTCSDCPPEPRGVKHFRQVMQTIAANRSAACP